MPKLNHLIATVSAVLVLTSCVDDSTGDPITDPLDALKAVAIEALVSNFHQPNIDQFALQSSVFHNAATAYCDAVAVTTATDSNLQALQDNWKLLMQDWAPLQSLRFGPFENTTIGSRFSRTQFWPTKDQPFIFSSIETLLTGSDSLSFSSYQNYSAVVQGLPVIEYLVFNTDTNAFTATPRRCELLRVAAQQLMTIADDIAFAWIAFGQDLLQTPNPNFADASDSLQTLFEGFWAGIELIKNNKLGDALGKSGTPINTALLESTLAAFNREMILENLILVSQVMDRTNGVGAILLAADNLALQEAIEQSITNSQMLLNSLVEDPTVILADINTHSSDYAGLENLYTEITTLVRLIKNDVTRVLAITVGFNGSDGD